MLFYTFMPLEITTLSNISNDLLLRAFLSELIVANSDICFAKYLMHAWVVLWHENIANVNEVIAIL